MLNLTSEESIVIEEWDNYYFREWVRYKFTGGSSCFSEWSKYFAKYLTLLTLERYVGRRNS